MPIALALVVALCVMLGPHNTAGMHAQSAWPRAQHSLRVEDTIRYSFMDDIDVKLGFAWAWTASDGERQFYFEYSDRGRGPRLTSRVRLGAGGLPVFMHTTGNDLRGSRVDERVELTAGHALWRSTQESGDTIIAGPALFLSLYESPHALDVQALLAAPGRRLRLLPQGEASLERVEEFTVANAKGETRRVSLYAVSGTSLQASLKVVDSDGTLFSDGELIREGWESALSAVWASQRRFRATEAARLVRLRRVPRGALVIRNARVFNPVRRTTTTNTTIVVEGQRIREVGPDDAVRVSAGAEIIDARGKTLLPGLWDVHMHRRSIVDAALNLASGITSVRDPATDTTTLLSAAKQTAETRAFWPRTLMAGLIEGMGPTAFGTVRVTDAAQARFVVDRYADLGATQVKLYNLVPADLLPIIAGEAHRRGLRVAGHVPRSMRADESVRAGQDEITHLHYLFGAFRGSNPPASDPREGALRQLALDMESDSVRSFVQFLRERDVAVDATLGIYEIENTARPGQLPRFIQPVANRLPPLDRRSYLGERGSGPPIPEGMEEAYLRRQLQFLRFARLLHENGVQLLIGTDRGGGWLIQRELELYVEAGISASDVLYLATLGAARRFGLDRELGTFEPGKLADFIMIDGDPLARMADIRRVVLTVKDGAIYDPAELHRALGIRPCCQ